MSDNKGYDFGNICRHCDYETLQPVECVVTGVVPPWVEGSFIYNGPGITRIGETSYQHCFDSAAVLQRVTVSGDSATYMSRFLRSETYKSNMKAGTITVGEFGTAPVLPVHQRGFLSKLRRITDMEKLLSDNTVVSVATVAGKLYALGETPFMQELCIRTLNITERRNLYRDFGLITQTPHPVEDGKGNSYTVGPSITITGSKYNIVKFPSDGSPPLVLTRLTPRWRLSPSYMHSLAITDNYLVILEMPLAMSVTEVFSDMFNNMAVIDGMKWHHDNVLLHVVELRTGKVLGRRYITEAMFMLHIANCYEDPAGDVVLDFPCYRDAAVLHDMFISILREEKDNQAFCERFRTRLMRLVLPVTGGEGEVTVKPVTLSTAASFENPSVNPLYQRRKHRYIYGMGVCPDGGNRGQVTKLDVETGAVQLFMEDELYIADPTFVPRPSAVDEDDGTLVLPCVRGGEPRYGCLVLLDGRSMTECGRVSYTPQGVVPMPMHGIFLPNT